MGRVCEKAPYGWLFLSLFLHGHLYFVHQYHLHQGLRHWCGEANLLGSSRCRYLLFGSLWNELVFQSWIIRVLYRLLELRWYALHLDIYRKCCLSKCGWSISVGVQVLDDDHLVFGSHQNFLLLRIFDALSPIVTMLTNVIYDLRIFLLFYGILIFLFSLMIGILGIGNIDIPGGF